MKLPIVNDYLAKLAKDFHHDISKSKNNDDIFVNLELLEEFVHRVPKNVLSIIKMIIKSKKPLQAKPLEKFETEQFYGKSHDDLIEICITLLDRIRYFETKDAFNIAIFLSHFDNQVISKKAMDMLEHIAKYNYFYLRKDLYTQNMILCEMEKWNRKTLLDNKDIIFKITKELLEPSFGGESSDYNSITFHTGPLIVSDILKDIRRRTIKLLQKIYGGRLENYPTVH